MNIDVFTSSTCGSCKVLKSMLDSAGIQYTTKDFFDNIDEASQLGFRNLPAVFVYDDVKKEQVTGSVDEIVNTLVVMKSGGCF